MDTVVMITAKIIHSTMLSIDLLSPPRLNIPQLPQVNNAERVCDADCRPHIGSLFAVLVPLIGSHRDPCFFGDLCLRLAGRFTDFF